MAILEKIDQFAEACRSSWQTTEGKIGMVVLAGCASAYEINPEIGLNPIYQMVSVGSIIAAVSGYIESRPDSTAHDSSEL